METVLIYKTECYEAPDEAMLGTGFSLLSWEDGPDRGGEDDGGRDYMLPQAYTQEEREGVPGIYNESGAPCSLQSSNGVPVLVDPQKRLAILLERDKKLLRRREAEGLTRELMAQAMQITQKQLFEWENCETEPTMAEYRRLASLLHCEVVDLI